MKYPPRINADDANLKEPASGRHRDCTVNQIMFWERCADDVINDKVVNNFRLDGMTIIKVDPPVCAEDDHFKKVQKRGGRNISGQDLQEEHGDSLWAREFK